MVIGRQSFRQISFVIYTLWMLILCHGCFGTPDKTTDYCQSQFFVANCTGNAVILMESAKYGRMQSGRCGIGSSSGNIGCMVDVLWYLDWRCSGRHHCKVYVADPVLHRVEHTCQSDLKLYLEARYTCVNIARATPDGNGFGSVPAAGCRHSMMVDTSSPDSSGTTVGYLSSINIQTPQSSSRRQDRAGNIRDATGSSTDEEEDGGIVDNNCPTWVIEASPGQRIRLTMVAFGGSSIGRSHAIDQSPETEEEVSGLVASSQSNACYDIGKVSNGRSTKTTGVGNWGVPTQPLTVCRRGRGAILSQSTGHLLNIHLDRPSVIDELSPFVIKYEVIGCRSLQAPSGGWIRIDSESTSADIGCNSTDEIWHLRCSGTKWNGPPVGNCSVALATAGSAWGASPMHQTDDSFPYGVLLVVAIGVALGVFIGGVLLTVVALLMKKRSATRTGANCRPGELDLLHSGIQSETYSASIYRRYQPHTAHLLPQTHGGGETTGRRQYGYDEPQLCDERRCPQQQQQHQQFYHRLSPYTTGTVLPTMTSSDVDPQRCTITKTILSDSLDDIAGGSFAPSDTYGSNNTTAGGGVSLTVGGPLCVVGGGGVHLYEAPASGFICCNVTDTLQVKQLQQQNTNNKSNSACTRQVALMTNISAQ